MTENNGTSPTKKNQFKVQIKQFKERLISIAESATKTILEFEDNCYDVTESNRVDLLLNCLKGIEGKLILFLIILKIRIFYMINYLLEKKKFIFFKFFKINFF